MLKNIDVVNSLVPVSCISNQGTDGEGTCVFSAKKRTVIRLTFPFVKFLI